MGSNYKSYGGGGKCGCNKRVKKAQRVPQRGPGVAELEKILSDQKQDHMKPLYTTTPNGPSSLYIQPPYNLMRPPTQYQPLMASPPLPLPLPLPESQFSHFGGSGNNAYVKPRRSDVALKSDSSNDSGLTFTQMMMMGDPHDSKLNANLVFQTNMMNNSYPSADAPNMGFNHFNKHCPSQRLSNKCTPVSPKEDMYAMKKARREMPSHPHPVYAQQTRQTIIENGRVIAENEKMMLRNILTLGLPSPTKGSSTLPIFVQSDSSAEQCNHKKPEESSDKSHQSKIFGFNLTDKSVSLDDTKLSLHHNAARAQELSLDLTLKL